MELPVIVRENPLDHYDRYYDYVAAHNNFRLRKRYVRDARNPFEWWADHEFVRRYRFSKDAVMHLLLPQIEPTLLKQSSRGLPIAPVRKLLLCLRFYATASYQASGNLNIHVILNCGLCAKCHVFVT